MNQKVVPGHALRVTNLAKGYGRHIPSSNQAIVQALSKAESLVNEEPAEEKKAFVVTARHLSESTL